MDIIRQRKLNTTKLEIIRTASDLFIENGYSQTSLRSVADKLDISPGHLVFYFPTKEHLLSLLVDKLCMFQWKLIKRETDDGKSLLLTLCLELMSMAAAAEENEIARDFFVSAYQSKMCLEKIRKNDAERAKEVFAEFCSDWTDEQFEEAETLVSGIEYATLNTTCNSPNLETRISGALEAILKIYNVPEEIRKREIAKVLELDYRSVGKQIFKEFKEYIEHENEQAFDEN